MCIHIDYISIEQIWATCTRLKIWADGQWSVQIFMSRNKLMHGAHDYALTHSSPCCCSGYSQGDDRRYTVQRCQIVLHHGVDRVQWTLARSELSLGSIIACI